MKKLILFIVIIFLLDISQARKTSNLLQRIKEIRSKTKQNKEQKTENFDSKKAGCSGGKQFLRAGLTDEEKKNLLDYHNLLRNKVALGGQYGQPAASNMMQMVWDENIARTAQSVASTCVYGHSNMKGIGENIAYYSEWGNEIKWNPRKLVDMWFDEVRMFSPSSISPFKFNYQTGHYTQIVWATSNRLGCGVIHYKERNMVGHYIVCQYKEQGNFIGNSMYKRGRPCSECRNGCSSQYKGLCRN